MPDILSVLADWFLSENGDYYIGPCINERVVFKHKHNHNLWISFEWWCGRIVLNGIISSCNKGQLFSSSCWGGSYVISDQKSFDKFCSTTTWLVNEQIKLKDKKFYCGRLV